MPQSHRPETHVLSNGIPVIFQHTENPVAATYWWNKTGSADENPKEAGFAHFLEHMLFKDAAAKETGKASTGQMARAIESLGGEINAYTSFDQTVYHVTCAAHHWEKVLDSFGQMAKPQKFLKSDFEREREVILEELRKNEDSPGRQLFQRLFSTTFAKHPYGRPVIGFVKTLNAAKVTDLEAFYKRRYCSENMGLILVGPLDSAGTRKKKLVQLLEKRFGKSVIPVRKNSPHTRARDEEIQKDVETSVLPFDVKTPTIAISFRVPDLSHDDVAALDLASGILGMGELGRLYQRMFYQDAIATEASGGLYVPYDAGMLYFQAEVDLMEKIKPAFQSMLDELSKARKELVREEEVRRVLVNSESEKLYSTQTADGMASRLGFLRFVVGDLSHDQEYLEMLRQTDAFAIRDAMAKYLDYRRMSIVLLVPKDQKDYPVDELAKMAREAFSPMVDVKPVSKPKKVAKKKSSAEVQPIVIERPSGMKVLFRPNPTSPVLAVHASVLGGVRLEDKDPGSSNLLSMTWTKGTRSKKSQEIAALVEGSAASMDGFSGRNTIGLSMTCLVRDRKKLSDLFAEVLMDATFPEDEVEHSKRVTLETLRSLEDHSAQLCSKLFLETLYENHPYGKMIYGTPESIERIHGSTLKEIHRAWVNPSRLVLGISGGVRESDVEALIAAIEARFTSSGVAAAAAKAVHPEPKLNGPRWVERKLSREQVHLIVGGQGIQMKDPARHALRVAETVLGGQSGRMFIELREKKSLAYTVSPLNFEGIEPGYVGTYIASQPGKKDEAVQGIRQVLETLAKKGPTPAEMKRAKEYFLGRRAMDLQSDSSVAAQIGLEALYGVQHRTEEDVIRDVESVTSKQVQEVTRKYFVEPPMVTASVG
ncbi:MAG: insulinase family protein [Bdellovibrionales bacterium]|nr:insulinase family protein [Bdellovibrionales bacterium]